MLTGEKLIGGVNIPHKLTATVNSSDGSESQLEAKVDRYPTRKLDTRQNYQLSRSPLKVDSELTGKLTHCPSCKTRVNISWKSCPDCKHSLADLAQGNAKWNALDWLAYYHERAAIAEYDGGTTHEKAERMAYESCIAHWMNKTPPAHTDLTTCPQCLQPAGNNALAVLTGKGHIHLHDRCHMPWIARRRQKAVIALSEMGIV